MGNSKLFNKQGKECKVTSPYGMRDIPELGMFNNYHIGTDYAFSQGTELVSPLNGEVLKEANWGDYGGQVFLYLPSVNKTLHFAHMTRIDVKQGQLVKAGQVIGLSGGAKGTYGAGTSTGAHLHIGMASGKVTSLGKGVMGDGLWTDIDKFNFFPKKDLDLVAKEVANGDYGNGQARKDNLKKAGYTDSEITEIQSIVNKNAGVEKPKPKPQPQNNIGKTALLRGKVNLYPDSVTKKPYPVPSGKNRDNKILDEKNGRYLIEDKAFSPNRVWINAKDVRVG